MKSIYTYNIPIVHTYVVVNHETVDENNIYSDSSKQKPVNPLKIVPKPQPTTINNIYELFIMCFEFYQIFFYYYFIIIFADE